MNRQVAIWLFLLVFSLPIVAADNRCIGKADSLIFEKYIGTLCPDLTKNGDAGTLIKQTGLFFLGKPYVAATLEDGNEEQLVVNLREFDCTTFIESCLALAQTLKSDNRTFDCYQDKLRSVRYRNGLIDGYASRLHYMSDWIYENQKQGLVCDITPDLGGVVRQKPVNYMSAHPASYKQLETGGETLRQIKNVEDKVNNRHAVAVIVKCKIKEIQSGIKDGDIILFATNIKGLDYSHIGIACWENGNLHFIHASSKAGEIVKERKTLVDYCDRLKVCTGISVLRVNI